MNHTVPLSDFVQNRPLPRNLDPRDRQNFETSAQTVTPDSQISEIHDVEVSGRGPLRHQGEYRIESFVSVDQLNEWLRKKGHWRAGLERLVQRRSTEENQTIWITDNWSFGYYHWMCDALPRLQMASTLYPLDKLTLLLPMKSLRFPFIGQSLAAFGLAAVRTLGRFERLIAKDLVLPAHVARTGALNDQIMSQMRERFRGYLDQRTHVRSTDLAAEIGDRVYISRRLAGRRRVSNENELLSTLHKHGFSIIDAEKLDWETQIRIAEKATCMVANHGAGLTNLMMMKPGSRVLEFRDGVDHTPNCYFNLAGSVDVDYYYMRSTKVNDGQDVHFGDVVVDPRELDRILREMLGA